MKKSILTLGLAGSLIIVTTGCGGGDDQKEPTAQEVTLEYKTSGTYDLSQYMAPTENKINNYREKTYEDNQGGKNYGEPTEAFPTIRFDINASTIKEYDSDGTDTIYTILNDRIKSLDADDNTVDYIVRYANIGDYIDKTIIETNVNGTSLNISSLCKLNGHLESKEINNVTYSDIIEISCVSNSNSSGNVGDNNFTTTSTSTDTYYLAKEVGEINSIEESCNTTILSGNKVSSCEKIITEITNIN